MQAVLIEKVEAKIERLYLNYELSGSEREQIEWFVKTELADQERQQTDERVRQQRCVDQLQSERQKLLQAHYADAIPLELLKSEQTRIASQLATAERFLASSSVRYENIMKGVDKSLRRLDDCHRTYLEAGSRLRREMNQAIFRQITVFNAETIEGDLTEEYNLLLHDDVRWAARQATIVMGDQLERPAPQNNRQEARTPAFAGRGSSNDWLVGAEGLEPPTNAL